MEKNKGAERLQEKNVELARGGIIKTGNPSCLIDGIDGEVLKMSQDVNIKGGHLTVKTLFPIYYGQIYQVKLHGKAYEAKCVENEIDIGEDGTRCIALLRTTEDIWDLKTPDEKETAIPLPKDHKPVEVTISVNKPKPHTVVSGDDVYCEDCEFREDRGSRGHAPDTDSCMHILNMTERPTHLVVMYKLIKRPEEINENNDCGLFVKKRGFIARLFGGKHKDRIGSGKKVHLPEWPDPPPRGSKGVVSVEKQGINESKEEK